MVPSLDTCSPHRSPVRTLAHERKHAHAPHIIMRALAHPLYGVPSTTAKHYTTLAAITQERESSALLCSPSLPFRRHSLGSSSALCTALGATPMDSTVSAPSLRSTRVVECRSSSRILTYVLVLCTRLCTVPRTMYTHARTGSNAIVRCT